MQSQVKKLAVICNLCFWLTIAFKYWKNARNIQEDVLNTIIILGMVAILANVAWLVAVGTKKRKTPDGPPVQGFLSGRYQVVVTVFNICSLLAQAAYMALGLL